jgi:hypothetical protein
MPATKEASVAGKSEYRVVVAAVTYIDSEPGIAPDGSEALVPVYKVARFGETVELSDKQAARLKQFGPLQPDGTRGPAVKPAGEDKSNDELTVEELKAKADEAGVTVSGSGANGAVLKDDLVNALNTYEQGQAA